MGRDSTDDEALLLQERPIARPQLDLPIACAFAVVMLLNVR
jgi:hypothetical protein